MSRYNYKPILDPLEPKSDNLDLVAAASGHGGYCPEGIPVELAVLSLLAAFGAAFGILYRAVTLKTGGRRKKRHVDPMHYLGNLQDFIWIGKILIFVTNVKLYIFYLIFTMLIQSHNFQRF